MRWAILTAGLVVLYFLVANVGPLAVGLWQDDAIYLCTAKSLAEGSGYRHIEIPGTPLQTKVPLLYPAVLALGFLISPDFPENVPLLLVPSALAAAGFAVLSMLYLRRVLGVGARMAWLTGILVVLSPAVLSLVRFTMSDLPYACLAAAALYALDYRYARADSARRRRAWLIASAALVVLAVQMRGIGLSLVAAMLLALVLRRRFRDAGLAMLVFVVCLAPWHIRQRIAARANGPLQTGFLESSELSYSLWRPEHPNQTARVVKQNVVRTAFGLAFFQLSLPEAFIQRALADAVEHLSWRTVCLHAICYAALALIVFGFGRSAVAGWRTLHLYALLYGGLVLVWPFEPYRFLVPWTPFLLYFLLDGVSGVIRRAFRGRSAGAVRAAAGIPPWVVFALLCGFFLYDDARIVTSTEERFHLREFPIVFSDMRAVERWVAEHTRPEDVIASAQPAVLFLATRRQGHYFWPDANPYKLYYGPDRTWSTLYVVPGASEAQYVADDLRRHFARVYQEAGIQYYVEHRDINTAARVLALSVRQQPDVFVPRYTAPGGTYTVYELDIPVR